MWRMKAINMKRVDREQDMHMQAWLNHQVTASKSTGKGKNAKSKPVYEKFGDFYDYDKRMGKVTGKKTEKRKKRSEKAAQLAEIAKRVNQKRTNKG